jgi:hypothetical protein
MDQEYGTAHDVKFSKSGEFCFSRATRRLNVQESVEKTGRDEENRRDEKCDNFAHDVSMLNS